MNRRGSGKIETMNFFSKVFGGKEKAVAPTTADAIQKLRETEDMLIKKQEFLERKIEIEIGVARKNGTKNKRGKSFAQVFFSTISCCAFLLISINFRLRYS